MLGKEDLRRTQYYQANAERKQIESSSEGIAEFLTGLLRYWTRLSAYAWFLVDEYPPFSFSERGYPLPVSFSWWP